MRDRMLGLVHREQREGDERTEVLRRVELGWIDECWWVPRCPWKPLPAGTRPKGGGKVRNIVNGSAPLYAWADAFGGRSEPLKAAQNRPELLEKPIGELGVTCTLHIICAVLLDVVLSPP